MIKNLVFGPVSDWMGVCRLGPEPVPDSVNTDPKQRLKMIVFVVQVKTELNNFCIEEEESLAAECVCSSKSLTRYRTLRQHGCLLLK